MEEIPLRRSLIHQSFPSLPKLKDKPENLLKSSENILDKKLILVSSRSISQIVIPIKAQTDRDNSTQTRLSTLQKPRILANHLAEKEKKFKVVVPSKLETSRKSNNKSPSETSQKFMSTTLIGVDLPHNTKEKLGSTSEFSVQTVKHISRISCDMTKTIAPVFFNSQIIPAKPDKKLTADEVILYMEYLNQNNNRFLI